MAGWINKNEQKLEVSFSYSGNNVIFELGQHRVRIPLRCLLYCQDHSCERLGLDCCPRASLYTDKKLVES